MSAVRIGVWLMFGAAFISSSATATRDNVADWKAITELSFKLSGRSPTFPCESTRNIYKENGKYIPKNIISTRMQIYKYDVVVTQPRYRAGVPFSLGIAQLKSKGLHTPIKPFPCWSMHQEGNCDAIQSAVDVFIDRHAVAWVLDAGTVNCLQEPSTKCSPKVLAISMATHKILKTIDLGDFVTEKSDLQYIVAENAEDFYDYVYISDAGCNAIIVLNAKTGCGRRLLLPPPIADNAPIKKALYMAILMKGDSKKYLHFTHSNCKMIYYIDTLDLHANDQKGCIHVAGKKPHGEKIIFLGTDGMSKLYFRKRGGSDIYMWDSNTSMKSTNWIVVQHGSNNRQVTHVATGPWKLLWVLETNYADFVAEKAGSLGASSIIHPLAKDWN